MVIPAELKEGAWVNWSLGLRNAKPTKVPCDPSGKATDITGACFPFDVVYEAYLNSLNLGIGYVFKGNGIVGLDVDKATQEEIDYWAKLPTYVELSPSGKGIHAYFKGKIPGPRRRNGRYELYEDKRFFTFTGKRISSMETIAETDLNNLYYGKIDARGPSKSSDRNGQEQVSSSFYKSTVPTNMTDLMQTLLLNDRFNELYNGQVHNYSSHSEAELALCSIIAKYTQDVHTIDSIMQSSKLARKKWIERRGRFTYGYLTIIKALR